MAAGCAAAERPPVEVIVRDSTGALAGNIPIAMHASDGSTLGAVLTDSQGELTYDLPRRGMVTHADDAVLPVRETWAGLRGGNRVHFGNEPLATTPLSVVLPGSFSGATGYIVSVGCASVFTSDPGSPVEVLINQGCTRDVVDVLVVATDAGGVRAFSAMTDVSTAAGSVAAPPWDIRTDSFSVTVTGIPSGTTTIDVSLALRRAGEYFPSTTVSSDVMNGSASVGISHAAGFADSLEYSVAVGFSRVFVGEGQIEASRQLDVEPLLLSPIVTSFDSGERVASWSPLPVTDAVTIFVNWDDAGVLNSWRLHVDGAGPSSLKLPALPAELASYEPAAGSVFSPPDVSAIDYSFLDGIDDTQAFQQGERPGIPADYIIRTVRNP